MREEIADAVLDKVKHYSQGPGRIEALLRAVRGGIDGTSE